MESIRDTVEQVVGRQSPALTTPSGGSKPAASGSPGVQEVTTEEGQALQAQLRRASGLPVETLGMRLSTLELRRGVTGLREALTAAKAVLGQELAWLTLCGGVGLGKTHIAIGIGWEWVEAGRFCRYVQASTLLERLRRTYSLSPEHAWEMREPRFETVFSWYCDVPLLILDDLGTEKLTDWAGEKLDTLIDHRYIRHLPLVVTTNIPVASLPPRIASRLQDRRLGKVITLAGPDYRLR